MKILSAIIVAVLLSAAANAQIVPILDLKVGGLFGGVKDGKFIDAQTAFKEMKAENEYGIINIESGKSQDDLMIKVAEPDAPCEDFYFISTELETKSGIAVGSNANWNTFQNLMYMQNVIAKQQMQSHALHIHISGKKGIIGGIRRPQLLLR